MIFLIEYDRKLGRIVASHKFEDTQRGEAVAMRLELELDNSRNRIDHEVVLLEAASQEALERTHRRYFASLDDLRAAASRVAG